MLYTYKLKKKIKDDFNKEVYEVFLVCKREKKTALARSI